MKKANLNKGNVKLFNDILEAGYTITEATKQLGYSKNWLFGAMRKNNLTTVSKIVDNNLINLKREALGDKLEILKSKIRGL